MINGLYKSGKFTPPEFVIEDEQQAKEFEALYQAYWSYIYKYSVQDPEGFTPDEPWYKRKDFFEQLEEEGMSIKVKEGY